MKLVTAESSAHWYAADGTPQHWRDNKSKPGEKRRTTKRDARKENLYPSVTTVLDVIRKPQLEAWKVEQGILAALTLPREDGEPLDVFARRVAYDAKETSSKAAEFGTRVHKAIEDWVSTNFEAPDNDIVPILGKYMDWHDKNIGAVECVEKRFCNTKDGYAGCIDMIAEYQDRWCVIDFKTQGAKIGKPMVAWDGYGEQLEAYRRGLCRDDDMGIINVMLSTNPDDVRIEVIDHTENRDRLWETFQAACTIWRNLNKFDPRENNGKS